MLPPVFARLPASHHEYSTGNEKGKRKEREIFAGILEGFIPAKEGKAAEAASPPSSLAADNG
jgi:hypothetical protein